MTPGPDWNTVLLALIAMFGTGFGAWLTYRANTTHTAVNSERTKTTAEIARLNEVITKMAEQFATLQSQITMAAGAKRPPKR
jgi:predicted RNase H-related nuclease YkuK (DUF458 family)